MDCEPGGLPEVPARQEVHGQAGREPVARTAGIARFHPGRRHGIRGITARPQQHRAVFALGHQDGAALPVLQ